MARILKKEQWSETIFSMLIDAKDVAKASKAGQFIILIPRDHGERVPLTIADANPTEGWVQIVFQVVGKSTLELSRMNEGDELYSFVGPLGMPSEVEKFDGKVVMIGGGIGIAPIHPIAKALKELGNHVISIIGARTADLLIMEDKMKDASTELIVATDDGSKGKKGFVNLVLEELLATEADNVSRIWAIGPPIMMKACVESAKKFNKPIIVSLNPIMVDGTGMCGACRVTVGGETKFACVDGPEFDGALVDFDELIARQRYYADQEKKALELYKAKEGIA
ncbi:sulfide/dihydroorotate dehydrogenase-like FAD/NAD-binding protein [Hippea alviniae]|uniref:sulfide/dihydroorotate dehydrogenase-like FAD/NAD-binding protein n=1 Tax=Hippea alviniae TaxID=1279027 RepID=UPI0003B55F1F|nr:sulfide/dihydroorotate dehydrogenase-like FAD/NAD-binding protein [Hippea alviniae]